MPLGTWFGKKRYLTITLPGKAPLTASQLSEWMEYDNIAPFDREFRHELRHGQIMALHCNLNRDPKSKPEPFAAVDFMNFVERPPEKVLTAEEIEKEFDKIFG